MTLSFHNSYFSLSKSTILSFKVLVSIWIPSNFG